MRRQYGHGQGFNSVVLPDTARLAIGRDNPEFTAAALTASNGDQAQANTLFNRASASPHLTNSKWYREIVGRFLKQDPGQLHPGAVGAGETNSTGMTIWQLAQSYLDDRLR